MPPSLTLCADIGPVSDVWNEDGVRLRAELVQEKLPLNIIPLSNKKIVDRLSYRKCTEGSKSNIPCCAGALAFA
jgi:hypothetical protein